MIVKFDKVLIASDFDGTLKNDDGIISTDVIEAIKYFMSEGGLFTVCTGRSYKGFHLYSNEYINAPVLLANGAMAYDYAKKEIVFCDGIGEEGNEPLRYIRDNFPEASIEMYPFDKTFAINPTEITHRHLTSQDIEMIAVNDPCEADKPWAKVMIGVENQQESQEIQKYLRNNYDDPIFLPTTGTFIELLKKGTDKGSSLLKLADYLGIRHKDVYAVGDGYNDIEMLDAAAGGFVPENGSQEALAHATHIVRSNNCGAVAHVIEILDKIY